MCFLQKTALNLVKCGLHSRTYYLHPHIGGSHSVLYFAIQATVKYINSNVLGYQGHDRGEEEEGILQQFLKVRVFSSSSDLWHKFFFNIVIKLILSILIQILYLLIYT